MSAVCKEKKVCFFIIYKPLLTHTLLFSHTPSTDLPSSPPPSTTANPPPPSPLHHRHHRLSLLGLIYCQEQPQPPPPPSLSPRPLSHLPSSTTTTTHRSLDLRFGVRFRVFG
ncbi:hypothetical protein HanIR_Chr11g0507531 [Helianthus annuus]|nr:hypothetical protein HanIR_Chr11g0507531 [Helianthus annuus]